MTIKTNTKESQRLKELMHREAGTPIRKQISEYLRCLKEGKISITIVCYRNVYVFSPWV